MSRQRVDDKPQALIKLGFETVEQVKKLADADGSTMAGWVRRMILREWDKRDPRTGNMKPDYDQAKINAKDLHELKMRMSRLENELKARVSEVRLLLAELMKGGKLPKEHREQ